jgi:uridine phosphorylase
MVLPMKNEWLTPLHEGGVQMHLRIRPGDIPGYVLAPGDPGRVPLIGKFWDQYQEVQQNREYRIAKGQYRGIELAACSTGIGGASTEIAIIELTNVGVHTIIRVGTCAALQEEIAPGDLVIHTGAVRLSGAADMYVPKAYPAVAHYETVLALIEAAEDLGYPYHVGITASVDSFYAGEVNPLPNDKWFSHMNSVIPDLKNARVLTFEMEAATLFVLANIFSLRGGSICVVAANRITRQRQETEANILRVCQVATHAVAILAEWDKQKQKYQKNYWFPSLNKRR